MKLYKKIIGAENMGLWRNLPAQQSWSAGGIQSIGRFIPDSNFTLQSGNVIKITIDHIGELVNVVA